ncbi:uncharacterized protein LOC117249161 isoform X1 [Tachysurus ichikawai]
MSLEPYSVMILDMAKQGLSSAEISVRISHENGTYIHYRRRMIKGYLAMKGVHAAETRIGTVLRTMHQSCHEARRQGARNLNPIP